MEEAGRGDPLAAALRLNGLRGLPLLPADIEAQTLAAALVDAGALPSTEPEDALHIAIATVAGRAIWSLGTSPIWWGRTPR